MCAIQSSKTLIINISLDHVTVYCPDRQYVVPYKDLERTLPKKLKEIFLQYTPKACIVLNWPWGFTALRIWSLSIQMLCDHYSIDCYSVSKIAFYKHYYTQGILPRFYRSYIWQKNNFWLYDFETEEYEKIHRTELDHYLQKIAQLDESYAFDAIETHAFIEESDRQDTGKKTALQDDSTQEQSAQDYSEQKLNRSNALIRKVWHKSSDGLTLQYRDQSILLDPAVFLDKQYKVDILRPNYMIDPTLS